MINIACLKFGKKYGSEYVNRLFWAVRRNTTVPFKFHCFTDQPKGIIKGVKVHSLPHSLPGVGWWQKLYLFSKEMPIEGRIFYVDLDTLITGNLNQLLSHNTGFVCLRDLFLARLPPNAKVPFGTAKEAVGSGVLSWEAGQHTQIWETFIKNPKEVVRTIHPHGDQKWIQKQEPNRLYWQDLFPNQIVSFKVHCRSGLPKGARIICYHGKPSIPESINTRTRVQGYNIPPTKWITNYWYDESETVSPPKKKRKG